MSIVEYVQWNERGRRRNPWAGISKQAGECSSQDNSNESRERDIELGVIGLINGTDCGRQLQNT